MQPDSRNRHATAQEVKLVTKDLPFMSLSQALWISDLIQRERLTNILEIGFFHGVSTCYLASAVAPASGHVTAIDIPFSAGLNPVAEELLRICNLDSFVTIVREPAGAAWYLMKMIQERRMFDFCYIDDAHSWSVTGFHFFLVEKLLRPGGYLLFDDLKWTVAKSRTGNVTGLGLTEEQKQTPQVGKVWELLVKEHPKMSHFQETDGFGLCQKRLE